MKTNIGHHQNWQCFVVIGLICLVSLLPSALPAQSKRRLAKMRQTPGCTLYYHQGPFWQNEGNLSSYVAQWLRPIWGPSIQGELRLDARYVRMTLHFGENQWAYLGGTPQFSEDGHLQHVGEEWIGIDAMLDVIANQLILDAAAPDLQTSMPIEGQEYLGGPLEVGIAQWIPPVQEHLGIQTPMVYEGEFKYYHDTSGRLPLRIELDDRDTTLLVTESDTLNILELAAIKAFAIQEALRNALLTACGPEPASLAEIPRVKRGVFPIYWRPIRILSNNPNQKDACNTRISLKFGQRLVIGEQ